MEFVFSKILTSTDVTHRLSIKTSSLRHFSPFEEGQYSQFLMAEDDAGHRRLIRLAIRRRGYPKPVLSTGWLHFVSVMNLKQGDEVLFFKEVDEATGEVTYKIRPFYIFL